MNRQQIRKYLRVVEKKEKQMEKAANRSGIYKDGQVDFSSVSVYTLCQSMQLMIDELMKRGRHLRDFDDKKRFAAQIQIIGGHIYILSQREDQIGED